MTRIVSSTGLAVLLAFGLHAAPAQAQLARTYVSSLGNDSNDCNRLTPCRTFSAAHGKTLAKGEITVLDPGGYGAVTITKAISIINDGVGEAGVLVSGGFTGITINAGAGDAVSLRGITIKGIGFGGGDGIVFNSGRSLSIENCSIRNLDGTGTGFGITFRPAPSIASTLAVSNTVVADNALSGIVVNPGAGVVRANFNRVEVYNNGGSGILVAGDFTTGVVSAVAVESVAAGNGGDGFTVSSAGAATRFLVVNSIASGNPTGILAAGTNAIIRVGASSITGNSTGVRTLSGGQLWSFGNNHIIDNTTDGTPATVPLK